MCSQFNSPSSSLMVLPKCKFLSSRPILDYQNGCQNSPPQDTQEAQFAQNQEDHHRQQDTQQQDDNTKKEEEFEDVKDSCLKVDKEDVGILKTPTSPKHSKRQMVCPPAPKKKKAIQVTKRKLFLDVYDEVESWFPPALLADLGNKIKKARTTSPIL
ncbi:cyclin-dependent protein kinase inhibitor SMR14 [Lycium barbarum]|uniref:cyclin-dependent protein kinase inhibitor SMR14 n=1 Tax=Lycium barbarum TaxID=112863 RepID=UPI00293E5E2A|nr:cyclin-dependent protein kinase inhibitor SMR14 [Lycium barbarum]